MFLLIYVTVNTKTVIL